MFNLRDFIFNALMESIGSIPDFQVTILAAGWYAKGVLSQEDLAAIQAALNREEE